MTVTRRAAWIPASSTVVFLVAACTGCDGGRPISPGITASTAAADPTVTSTTPDSATQDTTLDVVVTGSSFDAGSAAQWAIAGIPSSKVRTNATQFVNSRRLIANITIAVDADPVLYDVIVTTPGGKKGIGTELFAVKRKQTNPPAIFEYSASDGGFKIRSDHRAEYLSADGLRYIYEAGVCGVGAQIYPYGSGDATMSPQATTITGRQKAACGALRTVTIIFDQPADGGPLRANPIATGGFFHNFNELWQMPIGVEQETQGGFNGAGCSILRFRPDPGRTGNAYPGSDKILALRLDATTWRVRSKPYPENKAWCDAEGRLYHLPFEIIVRLK